MRISTIHALCQTLLTDNPQAHPLGPGFRVLDDREQFLFVYARLSDLGLSRLPKARPGEFLSDVVAFFTCAPRNASSLSSSWSIVHEGSRC